MVLRMDRAVRLNGGMLPAARKVQGKSYLRLLRTLMDPIPKPKRVRISQPLAMTDGFTTQQHQHQPGHAYKVPGYMVTDHVFRVALDHKVPSGETIQLFAREVVAPNKLQQQQPYLVYLQGGPGFPATLPVDAGGWLRTAANYFRVILLDQRGTGLSSPVSCRNLVKRGTPAQQAEYLKYFRADNIVKDCEIVRKCLVSEDNQGGRWSVLGHSFGGFCAVHYLCAAPEGLAEVLITGGIPPMIAHENPCDEVYMATFQRVVAQNQKYYKRFPQDIEVVWKIVQFLANEPEGGIRLPSGSLLTPRGLQLLGSSGLGYAGSFDRLHFILETAWDTQDEDELSYRFLKAYDSWMSWETNPLYVLLHEPIYSQGSQTCWSAERVRNKHFSSQFDAMEAVQQGRPVLFTGEMIFPWMLEDFKELQPLREVADIIQKTNDWGKFYDTEALESNSIPVASATFIEDMFVDFNLAQQSAQHIKGIRQWMTNEYMHSGIKDDGARIFEKLLGMARESILIT